MAMFQRPVNRSGSTAQYLVEDVVTETRATTSRFMSNCLPRR